MFIQGKRPSSLIIAAGAAFASAATAQTVVIPNANANVAGPASPFDTLTREFGRSYQQVIAASELGLASGSTITAITFRSSGFVGANPVGTWPPANLTWADYEIYLGRAANPPGLMSTNYATNVVPGTEIQVKDGPLTMTAASWNNSTAPPGANPWGFQINITPFVYTGGDLVMTVRHIGHASLALVRHFVDVVPNPTLPATQCMAFSTMIALDGTAAQSSPAIVRFTYTAGGGCYANCDGSTGNPVLTANDFQCFLNKYAASDPIANCDGSTGNPALTANDFQCFLNKFAAGCS